MAQDSPMWEKAYATYKTKTFKVKSYSKAPRPITKEPMVLQEELKEVNQKIRELRQRKKHLLKVLRETGIGTLPKAYLAKEIHLYALRLGEGHYYVGMTRNTEKRLKRHERGKGSMWSKQYGVVEMFDIRNTGLTIDSEAAKMEDDMTIEYALKYGADKVHGGGYCQRKPRWPDVVLQN